MGYHAEIGSVQSSEILGHHHKELGVTPAAIFENLMDMELIQYNSNAQKRIFEKAIEN